MDEAVKNNDSVSYSELKPYLRIIIILEKTRKGIALDLQEVSGNINGNFLALARSI